VLHVFQKKSKRGIATPRKDLDLIRQRLAEAERLPAWGRTDMSAKARTPALPQGSTGNVFADLGLPHPARELLRAKLTLEIYRLIRERGLTQAEAGRILGIRQPHVSALMRNRYGSFSVERLVEFLVALGQDVEITVRPSRRRHGGVSLVI
jgi:predicted XRE-type DNA-binding protein